MTKTTNLHETIQTVAERHGLYRVEAYLFVLEALENVLTQLDEPGHISGQKLLDELKDLARDRYGLMALAVLNEWGVHSTLDFGRIVFHLVNAELLTKTPDDSLIDFIDHYDFQKVFEEEYFEGRA